MPNIYRLSKAAADCGWPSSYKIARRWVFIHRTDEGVLQELRQGSYGPRSLAPVRQWPAGTKVTEAYSETVCRIYNEERRMAAWLDYVKSGQDPEHAWTIVDLEIPQFVGTAHDI